MLNVKKDFSYLCKPLIKFYFPTMMLVLSSEVHLRLYNVADKSKPEKTEGDSLSHRKREETLKCNVARDS